jgi:uncharacterized protein YndB with AHSA1/START domain
MTGASITASLVVELSPDDAFAHLVSELVGTLSRSGVAAMRLDPGPGGGIVELRGDDGGEQVEVARVSEWVPGERIVLGWHAADWGRSRRTEVELRFEPEGGGTRVTFEHRGWAEQILALGGNGDAGGADLVGWFADQTLAPLVRSMAPWGLGEWLTDRRARRPVGPRARAIYRYPKEHQPSFDATLNALALTPEDYFLEIGCGGGAFMSQALRSGCRAVAVDHSPEMVDLAREGNAEAVREGRLDVVCTTGEQLPFADRAFTAVAMTQVFFFLRDAAAVLAQCRRVLGDGGRLAVYTASPELRGTPAAPEPIVRQMQFYSDSELERMAAGAGFGAVSVQRSGGAQLLVARATAARSESPA